MADLDFKHNVQQIPNAASLPEPVKRSVSADVTNFPDVQSAYSNYAASTNWMSQIGSAVATRASNEIAIKLGSEIGKNPQGELSPAITNFDEILRASYKSQAHSTLGIQANKLITDSNIEMAKATRITPELITKTNKQVSIGLQNIFKNSPLEIKPSLELQYVSLQLNQAEQLSNRMFREQREDRKANTAYASEVNAESAHTLAISGDYEAALRAVEATRDANEDDVRSGISTPLLAKTNIDSARQSYLTGKYSHEYEKSRIEGKGDEFLRNLADKKPQDIDDSDYPIVISHVMQYINQKDTLRRQDQALAIAKFNVSLAENPLGITGAQVAELNSHLDPIQQQEASLSYVKTIKSLQNKTDNISQALAVYTDINKFPLINDNGKNGAWESTYQAILQRPESIASGMTQDTAKLYAAAAAPVAIPAYITELKSKLSTADPVSLETASQAVNYMSSHNLNQNLSGLAAEQYAMAETYGQLRQVMQPIEAAQKAHEVVYNKSKEQKEANKEALAEFYKTQKNKNESAFGMIKRIVQTPSNLKIRNLPGYVQKAQNAFEIYFNITNGDESTATKLTKQFIDTQYGESHINGDKELMYHPIENIPGIPHDAIGAIQSDIVNQANIKFVKDKKFYDEGKLNYWYEAKQQISSEEALTSKRIVDSINQGYTKHPITGAIFDIHNKRKELINHELILDKYKNSQPITIIKHNRSGKDEVFEGAVQANPWGNSTGNPVQPVSGGWDLMIKTDNGFKNIAMMNPLNSSIQYNPNVEYIKNLYTNTTGLTTLQSIFKNAPKDSLAYLMANRK